LKTIQERVVKVLIEEYSIEAPLITPQATFIDTFGLDSLDTVELIMAIEDEFKIEIPDNDAETLKTVGELEKYLETRVNHATKK